VAESEMKTLGHHAMIVAVILFRILYWICRAGKLNSSKVSLKTCCIPFLYLWQGCHRSLFSKFGIFGSKGGALLHVQKSVKLGKTW